MHIKPLIVVWRDRAAEARGYAEQFQEGSIAHTMLLSIAETCERLAYREERLRPQQL
jgi:hypothetical protein